MFEAGRRFAIGRWEAFALRHMRHLGLSGEPLGAGKDGRGYAAPGRQAAGAGHRLLPLE
jgi:hypothetical protein